MKFKTTILLAILNIVVFFFLFQQKSPFELKSENDRDELGILPYSVSEAMVIEVSGSGVTQPYRLVRDGRDWFLRTPIEWIANEFAVRKMVSQLEATDASVRFPVKDIESRDQSLKDFGLEDPDVMIRVSFENDTFEIPFGAPVEIGDRLYMLSSDKTEILVVSSDVLKPFLINLDELRSKKLFSIPEFEVQSFLVEFNDDNSRRRFTKNNGNWTIDTPFLANASEEKVLSALDELINANFEIIGDSLGDRSIVNNSNSFARFELLGNRRNSTLLISRYMINGEVNPSFYRGRLEGSSTLFLIPSESVEWWRTSQHKLRNRQIFDFELADVSKLELIGSDLKTPFFRILRLENREWELYTGEQRTTPVDFDVDSRMIVETLGYLKNLVVLDFVTDTPSQSELEEFGLLETKREIVVVAGNTIRLQIGHQSDNVQKTYVRVADTSSVYLIASELLDLVRSDPVHYRNRFVRLFEGNQDVEFFEIEDLSTGLRLRSQDEESFISGAKQALSHDDFIAIVTSIPLMLREFEVGEYLAQSFDEEGVLSGTERIPWSYKLLFHFDDEHASENGTIWFTKRYSGSGQIAYLEKENLVIQLNQHWIDLLHPVLFDQKLPEEHQFPQPESKPKELIEDQNTENLDEYLNTPDA